AVHASAVRCREDDGMMPVRDTHAASARPSRRPGRVARMAAAVALALLLCSTATSATGDGEYGLPDIGSSAAVVLSPSEQAEYGAETLRELRRYGVVMEDPLLQDWISDLGYRVVGAGERPELPFTFFLLNFRDVNA